MKQYLPSLIAIASSGLLFLKQIVLRNDQVKYARKILSRSPINLPFPITLMLQFLADVV